MNIDLNLINRLDININEYLTVCKIFELKRDNDIPFITDSSFLSSLESKGYLLIDGDLIDITDKARKHFKFSSIEEDITEVIEYFKEITGKTKTSLTSTTNRRFVRDRLNQNYSKKDLKKVIDIKYKEWVLDPQKKGMPLRMTKYLRLETLFNQEKFQKYIGEVDAEQKTGSIDSSDNFKHI